MRDTTKEAWRLLAVFALLAGCVWPELPPVPPFPTPPAPPLPTFTATPTAVPPATPVATPTAVPVPPTPTPTPGQFPSIDQITFLDDGAVGNWQVDSTVTSVSVSGNKICVPHTMAGKWPVCGTSANPADGNPWVVVKVNGKWLAFTYEWLGRGQVCKDVKTGEWGTYCNARGCPRSWHPAPGELIGLFMSTCARAGQPHSSRNARSDIRWVRWGGGAPVASATPPPVVSAPPVVTGTPVPHKSPEERKAARAARRAVRHPNL